jgi:hypothetical protein
MNEGRQGRLGHHRTLRMRSILAILVAVATSAWVSAQPNDQFLTWDKDQATSIGAAMRRVDNVGNRLSIRGLKTDRAINYKMRATWLTAEVIRATARLVQLNERLSPERTRALVDEAEAVSGTIFLVELDPNEGSGIIPDDWVAILQPKGLPAGAAGAVRGARMTKLADVRALGGVFKRDYAYDAFWIVFPLTQESGAAVFGADTSEVELVVNIRGREALVSWPVPESLRRRG